MNGVFRALVILGLLSISAPASRAFGKDGVIEAGSSDPCASSSRYVMPEGVVAEPETPGVAPADLPGSRSGFALPPKIGFDLEVNPLDRPFDDSRLKLGQVEIDRKTGQSTIDGKPLGGPSEAEAACAAATKPELKAKAGVRPKP